MLTIGMNFILKLSGITPNRPFFDQMAFITDDSEGAILKTRLSFPPEYPVLPPKMKFISEMWHPNSMSNSQ